MLVFPNAKINLGLQITERRADGYHNLLSCFVPIGWADALEVIPAERFSFASSGLFIPGDSAKNLCVKAYNVLNTDFGLPPVQMHLHKIVPIGAGLGGGSSDAAFALKLLNNRFELGLTTDQLESYARPLGADCAFFVQNRPMYCIEKGDVFMDIDLNLTGFYLILVYPNVAISTAEAYAGVRPNQPETPLRELLNQPIETWKDAVKNDFEESLFPKYPLLAEIKQQLYDLGAMYASMSGSGSTIYGLFSAPPNTGDMFARYTVWEETL
jgi:4-diphosphocytidyl-2-C-methyl-D-erythritol kinase